MLAATSCRAGSAFGAANGGAVCVMITAPPCSGCEAGADGKETGAIEGVAAAAGDFVDGNINLGLGGTGGPPGSKVEKT